jgi:hypothetical protein
MYVTYKVLPTYLHVPKSNLQQVYLFNLQPTYVANEACKHVRYLSS